MSIRLPGAFLLVLLSACKRESPASLESACGEGTHLEGTRCLPNTAGPQCGSGTVEQAGMCVATLSCGPGTIQQGTQCIPSAEKTFASWDDFYREYLGSSAEQVSTDLPATRVDGKQVSRDFEVRDHLLSIFNSGARAIRLNGKNIRIVTQWPEASSGSVNLDGAQAFTYPGTDLLACVQGNFEGLGQSGSFQNIRQLNLIVVTGGAVKKTHALRVTGYGFNCQGVYQDESSWRLAQIIEGDGPDEKVLTRWALDDKGFVLLPRATSLRVEDDGRIVAHSE